MDPQPQLKPSAKVFWLVWLTSLALLAGSIYMLQGRRPVRGKSAVYRRTTKGWERLPELGATPYHLHISSTGAVWVQSVQGLSRLDGATWRFAASDFNTGYGYPTVEFTLDGDEVWGATTDGVVHFDGQRWQLHPKAIATDHPTSMVASKGKLWVIDQEGSLWHFEDGAWATRKLDLPDVRWNADGHFPRLALTGNGRLWIAYQGLWRSEGTFWKRLSGVTSKARFLGATSLGTYVFQGKTIETHGEVWVEDSGEIVGFADDAKEFARYTRRDLGLTETAGVRRIDGQPPVVAVASSRGVVWYDGIEWHIEDPKQAGVSIPLNVAVGPGGSLWGIGFAESPGPSWAGGGRVSLLIVNVLGNLLLFAPLWWLSRWAKFKRQATRAAVLHATGTPLEDGGEASPGRTVLVSAVAIFAGFAAYDAVKRYRGSAPTWLPLVFLLAAHAIPAVARSLKKRKARPSDPIVPGGAPRYDWAKSLPAILGSLVVMVLLYGDIIARHFHIRWLAAIPGVLLLLGGGFLLTTLDALRCRRVERLIKRCQYRQATEMLDGPLAWLNTWLWKLTRENVLFFSGRAREAEAILRELVEAKKSDGVKALVFEDLGHVLIAQKRFDEAQRAFEGAIRLMPKSPAAYAGLAELRLLQDGEPVQALEYAERALALYRSSSLAERKTSKERVAVLRGNQAWALARLGRGAEAQQAIEAAPGEMDMNYLPQVAGFHWRAGMAMMAMENGNVAAGHFRRAAELDPEGYYGKLAARELGRRSVWGSVGVGAGRE